MSSSLDGNGVAAWPPRDWQCPKCSYRSYCTFDADKGGPGNDLRCLNCKAVFRAPPAPSQTAVEPVAMWAYRDSFSKPDEWDVTFDAKEAQAITEAVAAGEEGYACEPLIFASTLTAQAAALVAAEKERDHARGFVERLQAALFFWMPSVRPETDVGLARSAGDDAYLFAGYSGEGAGPCWGDDMIARAEAAEKRIAELEAGLEDVFRLNDECSGAEPSVSVLMRAIDELRARRLTHQEKNNAG